VWISHTAIDVINRFFFRLSAFPAWLTELVKGNYVARCFEMPKRKEGGGWWLAEVIYKSPYQFAGY